MNMRVWRPPEAPWSPLRRPWGTLGAPQGAVGAVLVPPGERPGALGASLGDPGAPFLSNFDVFSELFVEASFDTIFLAFVLIFIPFSRVFWMPFGCFVRAGASSSSKSDTLDVDDPCDEF